MPPVWKEVPIEEELLGKSRMMKGVRIIDSIVSVRGGSAGSTVSVGTFASSGLGGKRFQSGGKGIHLFK
jgi:hypothetical protein